MSSSPIKRAELASTLGAGILGVGIGVLVANHVQRFGAVVLALGLLLHGWGMLDKHRLEKRPGAAKVWWSELLYWICWIGLAALASYVVFRMLA